MMVTVLFPCIQKLEYCSLSYSHLYHETSDREQTEGAACLSITNKPGWTLMHTLKKPKGQQHVYQPFQLSESPVETSYCTLVFPGSQKNIMKSNFLFFICREMPL